MERMKDFKAEVDRLVGEYIVELEEENKTLKDNVEFLHSCLDDRDKSIAIMQEENKKLKEKVSELEDVSKDYDILSKDFITATGEIEFRKDEVERFKTNAVQDMAEITELENQIKKLKEDVDYRHHRAMVAERGGEDEE